MHCPATEVLVQPADNTRTAISKCDDNTHFPGEHAYSIWRDKKIDISCESEGLMVGILDLYNDLQTAFQPVNRVSQEEGIGLIYT